MALKLVVSLICTEGLQLSSALSTNPTIFVVGSGLAGLMSAYEARQTYTALNIVIVEKNAKGGGNSVRASTGISAARTSYDIESFKQDCLKSSLRESDSQLIAKLVEESPETMQVLEKELSLPMPRLWPGLATSGLKALGRKSFGQNLPSGW
jgi:succinate dehydrogenase/fumarate reductase flavoprotein subunit